MKILFSPSEDKVTGGILKEISKDDFIFENLYEKRVEIFKKYQDYILKSSDKDLQKFFGLSKISQINELKQNSQNQKLLKAVLRYSGVGYKALDYETLNDESRKFIDQNVLIFSNVFGPILAKNLVPFYKIKQGENLPDLDIAKFYKDNFSDILDKYLNDEILDLRAGFYEKFYEIKKPFYSLKFLKSGKILSHWAKFYRGFVLRKIAQNKADTIDKFLSLKIENLQILEIRKQKNKTEIIFEIL